MRALLPLLLIAEAAHLQAASFSQIVVFGDSLTDTGNSYLAVGLPPSPPYFNGRFSNGPLWIEHLAAGLGLPVAPFLAGGTNYAVAGARTGADGTVPGTGVTSIVDFYRALNPVLDPNALFVLTGGGNDLLDASVKTLSEAEMEAKGAANNLLQNAANLATQGAKHILMASSGNVGATPGSILNGDPATAAYITGLFNSDLKAGVDFLQATVPAGQFYFVDQNAILNAIIQDAVINAGAKYGITDVLSPCSLTAVPCSQALWFDLDHPTSKVHEIYGAAALAAMVPEPSSMALMGLAVVLGVLAGRRAIVR
jgi:outer membrane lipase/esterase